MNRPRHSRPVLLIFTLGPEREHLRRNLLPACLSGNEYEIHQRGLAAAITAGHRSGCHVVVAAPQRLELGANRVQWPQTGSSFGSRLRHAVRRLQAEHPSSPLVIVGTDVPNLDCGHIQSALARLESHPGNIVMGPCPDGGLYLLAAKESLDEVLAQARWCRSDTLVSLTEGFQARNQSIHLLSPLRDLDCAADLETWLSQQLPAPHDWQPLVLLLRKLLAGLKRPLLPTEIGRPLTARVTSAVGRSPPC